jgi:hypothetical protein
MKTVTVERPFLSSLLLKLADLRREQAVVEAVILLISDADTSHLCTCSTSYKGRHQGEKQCPVTDAYQMMAGCVPGAITVRVTLSSTVTGEPLCNFKTNDIKSYQLGQEAFVKVNGQYVGGIVTDLLLTGKGD